MKTYFDRNEARELITLATPVFLAMIAQTSMGFVDIVVAGRVGPDDMAGVALSSSFWMPSILFGYGLLMAITPLVAQALGAGNTKGIGSFLRQGAWISLGISALLMLFISFVANMVAFSGKIEPAMATVVSRYLLAIRWGIPGLMLYCVFRAFLDGYGKTRPAMIAGFVGVAANIPLNIIFAFGYLGMPALGGVGCGVASAIVCWIMAFVMFLSVRRENPITIRFEAFSRKIVSRMLRIGFPGACALLMETSTFAIIAVLIAPLGAIVVAGHQVALNVSGLLFVIPLSLGAATSIRVGTCLGAGELERSRLVRRTALTLALGLAALTALSLILFRAPIARIYTDDPAILSLTSVLLIFAALYQMSDATQVLTISTLRGYNDTRAISGITFISYWMVALPLGYTLGRTSFLTSAALGAQGFWISVIIGLSLAAVLLLWRLAKLERLSPEEVKAKLNR